MQSHLLQIRHGGTGPQGPHYSFGDGQVASITLFVTVLKFLLIRSYFPITRTSQTGLLNLSIMKS